MSDNVNQERTEPTTEGTASSAGTSAKKALHQLLLDPNNFRFIEQSDYVKVPDDKAIDSDVQRRTTSFLLGNNNEYVRDLIASLTKNGWLPLEQIQVKELSSRGKYLVVEGNRRIAALKFLKRRYDEGGIDLGKLDPKLFDSVPVVLYEDAGEAQHLVIMGLSHISGKRKWPAVNQARALHKLMHEHQWSEDDVCAAIGIEKRELRRTLKALTLCDAYIASEYGDQFRAEQYNLFREVVRSPDLSAWLQWNEETNEAESKANLQRLFSWFSREDTAADDADSPNLPSPDPVVTKGADVRELAKIIHDENALRGLDETRRLTEATFSSELMMRDKLADGLRRINSSIDILFTYAARLSPEDLQEAQRAMDKLRGVFVASSRQATLVAQQHVGLPFNTIRRKHFYEINVQQYRRFRGVEIPALRRINLFVGPNNAGKTSLLESVHLLISQNDVNGLLNLVRRRGKLNENPPPLWVKDQIPEKTVISGTFDEIPDNHAEVEIVNAVNGDDLDDKTFYLTTIDISGRYSSHRQHSTTHLFEQRERKTTYTTCQILCPVVFSSPFVQHDTEFLADLFNRSVEAGSKKEVVAFVRDRMDAHFLDVDAHTGYGSKLFTRFRVNHEEFAVAPDITTFGEGAQRIFHIGLLFAYAKDGVVLLDEFENAIHFSLLRPFCSFVHDLACKFNVQLFLTSHSKECVDAFAQSSLPMLDLSAYALRVEIGATKCYHYPGEKLQRLIEEVNLELRGAKEGV